MAVVNEHGASATTLQEYLERLRAAYREIDPDWNLEPESPDGLALAIWAELLANLDEAVLHAYQSVDPLTAIGQQLDRIAQFAGLTRQAATPSTATVTFTGTNGTLIPAGTQIRNSQTDTLWTTDGDVTISDGTATVGVTCTTPGPEPAAVGTLSIIATPVGGVQSVTNTAAASLGRSEEGDDAFRVRRYESVALPGSNQVDSLYAAIGNVDGVKQVRIYENEEDAPDANGVAGHSLAIFVDGGDDADVLKAIASRKNPGTGLNRYATFPNKVNDDTTTPAGQPVNITFFRPELITVYCHIKIANESLSEQDKQRIRQAVIDYSLSGFTAPVEGFNRRGIRIGEAVAAGRFYTPVNRIVGESGYVEEILLGLSEHDISATTLPMAFNQLGVLSADTIIVEYI